MWYTYYPAHPSPLMRRRKGGSSSSTCTVHWDLCQCMTILVELDVDLSCLEDCVNEAGVFWFLCRPGSQASWIQLYMYLCTTSCPDFLDLMTLPVLSVTLRADSAPLMIYYRLVIFSMQICFKLPLSTLSGAIFWPDTWKKHPLPIASRRIMPITTGSETFSVLKSLWCQGLEKKHTDTNCLVCRAMN